MLTSNDQLSGKDLMGFIQEDLGKLKLVFGKLETLSVGLACFDPSVLAFLASSAQISLHKFEILPSRIQYSAQGAPEITDYLLNLFSSCQNLESVNLEGYLQFENLLKEDNAGLVSAAIGKNLLKLKAIRTPKNVTMDAKLMSSLLIGCTKLEDIALLGIPKASDPSSVDLVRCLMNNGQSLRNVSLGSETVMKENSNTAQGEAIALSEDSPHAMLEPCFFEFLERRGRSLRGLEIRGWSSSDRLLRAVAKHCSVLDLLILNPCFGVRSEAAIRDIITRTRTLRHLMLENTLPAASVAAELAHNEIKTRGGCVRMELDIGIVYA
ncbi:hypothetical protein BC829DRAFT_99287 [Chytridium lagenaria]|nr:hypothetical protein BC829DRAFT_99287 [Chytridium lagenaria]